MKCALNLVPLAAERRSEGPRLRRLHGSLDSKRIGLQRRLRPWLWARKERDARDGRGPNVAEH